jgi:hypothetical protein
VKATVGAVTSLTVTDREADVVTLPAASKAFAVRGWLPAPVVVDVFVFHTRKRIAFAGECKDVLFGRTPAELVGELDRLFRGSPKDAASPSRAQMHMKRIDWLAANWKYVTEVLGLPKGKWKLSPVMVLEAEIPSTYIISPPFPVVPFSSLSRTGFDVFDAVSRAKTTRRCEA